MFRLNKCIIFLFLLFTCVLLFSSFSFAVNTNLTIENVECYYSEEFNVSVQLTDENKLPLDDKKVEISVDGWKFGNLYTDSNGRIDLVVPYDYDEIWYDAGAYNISASFLGSSEYGPSSANGTVTILQMPTKLTMKYNENKKQVLFYLIDKNDNPVGSGRINLFINNKFYLYALTDEYGEEFFDLSHLSPGEYLITANNDEMIDNYLTDNSSMKITIENNNKNSYSNVKNSELHLVNMKKTGLPIINILLCFLTLITPLIIYKKENDLLTKGEG